MEKNNFKKIILLNIFFSFLFINISYAANLSIDSNNLNVTVGDIVTSTVFVNSSGDSINNVEGVISVPSDMLEIQSVNTAGSILNLWVEQPTYSRGAISFNGGVTNPGYVGSSGKVLSVSMKAIKNGTAQVSFQSANVRANDGLGTDVLKNKSGTTINISSNIIVTPPPIIDDNNNTTPVVLKTLDIYSSDTPNSDIWYKADKTTFSWDAPNNTIALKTLFDSKSNSDPSILYNSLIESKTIEDLNDGIWYFHAKYQTSDGWSKAAHKKIKIDNTPPEEIDLSYEVLDSGFYQIKLSAYDKTSYISKYILSTEGKENIEIKDIDKEGNAIFVFPADYSGVKQINVEAFDEADNSIKSNFTINFPTFEIPKITKYPDSIIKGNNINIEGVSSYIDSKIELYFESKDGNIKTYNGITRNDGSFYFVINDIEETGEFNMYVKIFIKDTLYGVSSDNINIKISSNYLGFIKEFKNIIIISIIVLAVVIYFIFVLFILKKEDKEKNRKIRRIKKEIIRTIENLKDSVLEDIYVTKINKRIQNDEIESVIFGDLLQDLKNTEKVISLRIKNKKTSKKVKKGEEFIQDTNSNNI